MPVIDEGSFYRVAGTYIFDKCRIKNVDREDDKLIIRMKDDDVVLTGIEKGSDMKQRPQGAASGDALTEN